MVLLKALPALKAVPVLWAFSRPHTIVGTAIAVPAIGAFAGAPSIDALPAALCANIYVTGLNQLTDRAVDKVNKPSLPLARETLSPRDAKIIVALAGITALACSRSSVALVCTTLASGVLGTLYSVEPFRWKRRPLLAALSIVAVRGLIVNIGFHSHALGRLAVPRGPTCFFSAFAWVIAILKDVPDMRGDAMHGLPSYALRLGRETVLGASAVILALALVVAAVCLSSWMSVCAIAMAASIAVRTFRAATLHTSTTELYQYYWKCFFACYVALFFV